MKQNRTLTRRAFVARATLSGLALAGVSNQALAGGHLPKLDPQDPTAKSLSYTHASNKPDQNCRNCQLYQGSKQWGGCPVFAGKEVNADGWCSAWVKKAS